MPTRNASFSGLALIQPLDRTQLSGSLHGEIYGTLRCGLMAGDFVPGQAFSIRTLAERFGTSLIPVRDALKQLVAERAIVMLANRTFCVPRMTRSRFEELLQIRISLEPILCQRAATAISTREIRELELVNDAMQQAVLANQVREYLTANRQFHFQLYEAARSEAMLPLVETLWMQVGPFLNGVFTTVGTAGARDNHAHILNALRGRDDAEAARAVASDLSDAAEQILARDDLLIQGTGAPAGFSATGT